LAVLLGLGDDFHLEAGIVSRRLLELGFHRPKFSQESRQLIWLWHGSAAVPTPRVLGGGGLRGEGAAGRRDLGSSCTFAEGKMEEDCQTRQTVK